MPQVASALVIPPPVRPDAPPRAPGQGDSAGTFGALLDPSDASDAGSSSAAPAKPQDAPTAQAQADAPADAVPAVPLSVDLALLVPELPADIGATATNEKGEGERQASAEATPGDPVTQNDDAANVAPDPKLDPVPIIPLVAPAAPAPAASTAAASGSDAVPRAATGANAAAAPALLKAALATTAGPIGAPPVELPASGRVEAVPTQPDAGSEADQSGSATATVSRGPGEPSPADAPFALGQAEGPPAARTEEGAPETRTAKNGKGRTEAGKEPGDTQLATKPAQPHPPNAPRSADPPLAQEKPTAHPPHPGPSEHASSTAHVAVAAAHDDLAAPTSVAQAVVPQTAGGPAVAGLNAAIPLTSPLQSFWQPTSQRIESADNTIPIAGLAVEIVSRAHEGLRRFEIRLDPPELGRIDVRLDVDRGGNVTSRLTVERAETLDLLRRDAPQLERALQHAGLNTEGGLQFSLRDQNFANRDQAQQSAPVLIIPDDEPAATEAARRGYGRLIGLGGGVDIRV